MTEQTIFLDPDPRDWRSRKLQVQPSRWYATVQLNRDGYVDAAHARGHDSALPSAYEEAADRACNAGIDRIWYDGYPGSFLWGSGPRWVTLYVPYPYVKAALEALRVAEIDHDYSKLHALADRLALPINDWLAPGERELVRGVDFTPPPTTFLRFLRGKAKELGVRLNGRATAGSVWVRPTLPPGARWTREAFPERYPEWVDRWSGHTEPGDAPLRPWVGGREQNLSAGATPVEFRTVETPSAEECPCGMILRESAENDAVHTTQHMTWTFGVRSPKNLTWSDSMAVVTTQSPIAWRKLAYQVGRLPQKENHYDFNSWFHLGPVEVTPDNVRAYLLKANGYVIGYLAAHDTNQHYRWDLVDGSSYGDQDDTLRPRINLVWVAAHYRRQGVGATLVQAIAEDFGCTVADVSWSDPISAAGRRLARRIMPGGIWVS
ncbi:GNAT family N-acetyltransferase [Nocardiopsis eucommiae]|uniref:GNAT family N-acetyltransferase n=1 Tax=Nocardiopsis eucommiae TaxID=2831970 RepID=A0A975LCL1_9ACTN|nr:GNAT family N-acetyltransferase [Nocardiopsis eucommiae]